MSYEGEITSEATTGWKTLRWTFRTGQKIARVIQATAGAMLIAASAIAEQYNVADVSGFVKTVFDGSAKVAMIAALASVAFILFKTFMHGPKGFSASKNLDDGE